MSTRRKRYRGPRPFYSRDGFVIFHGDAAEVLPTLPRGVAHLMVTDPPYGVKYQSGRKDRTRDRIHGDDDASFVPGVLELAVRGPMRKSRHVYIFGPESLTPESIGGRAELIWDKEVVTMGDLTRSWSNTYERITFGVITLSPGERAKGGGALAARMRQGSVLRVWSPRGSSAKHHPTAKPVALLRRLIESSSLMGERVLDPFMGSGSTLVAAAVEGRIGDRRPLLSDGGRSTRSNAGPTRSTGKGDQVTERMRAAVKAVVNAWTVSGPHPEYHRFEQARLGRKWPTLQTAITNLVHAHDTEAAAAANGPVLTPAERIERIVSRSRKLIRDLEGSDSLPSISYAIGICDDLDIALRDLEAAS